MDNKYNLSEYTVKYLQFTYRNFPELLQRFDVLPHKEKRNEHNRRTGRN